MACGFKGSALCISCHQHIWICHLHQRCRLRMPSYLWSRCQNYNVQNWRLIILSIVNFVPCHLITVFNRLLFTPTHPYHHFQDYNTLWSHQMETISALLVLYAGSSPVPAQRPVTRSFDVFFDLRLNLRLSKQLWGWWFETPSWSLWRQCNRTLAHYLCRYKNRTHCKQKRAYIKLKSLNATAAQ